MEPNEDDPYILSVLAGNVIQGADGRMHGAIDKARKIRDFQVIVDEMLVAHRDPNKGVRGAVVSHFLRECPFEQVKGMLKRRLAEINRNRVSLGSTLSDTTRAKLFQLRERLATTP